jgi:hypothetical protein
MGTPGESRNLVDDGASGLLGIGAGHGVLRENAKTFLIIPGIPGGV